jgi:hypothetical protein
MAPKKMKDKASNQCDVVEGKKICKNCKKKIKGGRDS